MATKLNRSELKKFFSDGERPTGDNFESAWKSFLNQTDDNISYNDTSNNIELGPNTGLVLGNPTVGVTAGTLRFNSSTGFVQFYDGTDFKDIASGAGAFVPVGAGPSVAFSGGNVGIGTASTVPTHRLEIPLGDNTDSGQQILLGNLVIHKGPSTASGAYIGNTNFGSYALFQDSIGTTKINASNAAGSQLSLAINDVDKFLITQDGDIVLSPTTSLAIRGEVNIGTRLVGHTVTINNLAGAAALVVNGFATKSKGVAWDSPGSDARIKKEIRPYQEGLDKIIQLKPVVFKYNGKGEIADNGDDNIGLIAQDVQKVAPEMIFSRWTKLNPEDEKETELLNYNFHNVLFMFINAIKELNARLEKLEKSKTNAKRKTNHSS
jgi:hypothetical protein